MDHKLTRYGPGKYDFLIDSIAHSASLAGCDDECGDVATTDWFGILRGFDANVPFSDVCAQDALKLSDADRAFLREHRAGCILREDNQGFVDVTWHSDRAQLEKEWAAISENVARMEAETVDD